MARRRALLKAAGYLFLATLVIAFASTGAVWLAARASLPVLDGSSPVAGLGSNAEIVRDDLGVVTITAGSQSDAFRALGYVHAQERFFEMDLLRRSAAGELAELLGPSALGQDIRNRPHLMRARASAAHSRLPANHRLLLMAYAEGVNAGLAGLSARPWQYLLLGQSPRRWTEYDTLLAGYAMFLSLHDSSGDRESGMTRLRQVLPDAVLDLVMRDGTSWDAPLMGPARGNGFLPAASELDLRRLPAPVWRSPQPLEARGEPGSNSFAVGGPLTNGDAAVLANDMHSALRVPGLWFRARLIYPGSGGRTDVSGFTLPGLPSVIAGSNGHVAWGFTNSYVRTVQWLPAAPCGVAATCREFEARIRVRGAPSETSRFTLGERGGLRREIGGRHFEFDWLAYRPDGLNLGLIDANEARSSNEVLRIAARAGLPTGNLVAADREGAIGWTLAGPVMAPAGQVRDRPVLINPPSARLWTANNRVYNDQWLERLGDGGFALGVRAYQIRRRLYDRARFGEQDMLAIQLDDRALLLDRWRALLLRAARDGSGESDLRRLAAAARDWTGRAEVESHSYRLVREWRLAVHARILDGLLGPGQAALGDDFRIPRLPQFEGVAWEMASRQPAHLLSRRYARWNDLLEDAARDVAGTIMTKAPAERSWGARNTARICHPLAAAIPVLGRAVLCMPADALPGDTMVPRVQGPSFGATQRMVVAPSREAKGFIHMPGGQSGHLLSPFFGAGHQDWVEGRASPFLPGPPRHRLVLVPKV